MWKSQSSSSEILQPSQPPSIRSLIMAETSCTIGSTRQMQTVTTSSPSNICLTSPEHQWGSSMLTENYGINTNSNSGSVMRGSFLQSFPVETAETALELPGLTNQPLNPGPKINNQRSTKQQLDVCQNICFIIFTSLYRSYLCLLPVTLIVSILIL